MLFTKLTCLFDLASAEEELLLNSGIMKWQVQIQRGKKILSTKRDKIQFHYCYFMQMCISYFSRLTSCLFLSM